MTPASPSANQTFLFTGAFAFARTPLVPTTTTIMKSDDHGADRSDSEDDLSGSEGDNDGGAQVDGEPRSSEGRSGAMLSVVCSRSRVASTRSGMQYRSPLLVLT